jgi:hypothetical protein
MIDRFLRGDELKKPLTPRLPQVYVDPVPVNAAEALPSDRATPPTLPIEIRKRSFAEVELALSLDEATREARRCLRCDLEFTKTRHEEAAGANAGGPSL